MKEPDLHPSADAARTIETSRVLNFARERVVRAWIEPDRLARWWGPKGFTNTFHECDPRPGGTWWFTMHAPDGGTFENRSVFQEVSLPERIVIHHVSPPVFRLTASFEDLGGKTRITWRMVFESAEVAEKVRGFAPAANEQNLDRLEAELASMA